MRATNLRRWAAFGLLAVISLTAAGCDKCGNRINLVTPSIQHACGDNAGPR